MTCQHYPTSKTLTLWSAVVATEEEFKENHKNDQKRIIYLYKKNRIVDVFKV